MISYPKTKPKPEFRLLQCDTCGSTGPISEDGSEQDTRLKWETRAEKV